MQLTMMDEKELLSYTGGQEVLDFLKENNVINGETVKLELLRDEDGKIYTGNLFEDGEGISFENNIYQEKEEKLKIYTYGSMGYGHCNDWTEGKTMDQIRDIIQYSDSDQERYSIKLCSYSKEKGTIVGQQLLDDDQVSDDMQEFEPAYDAIIILSDMKENWEVYDPDAWERLSPDKLFYIVLNETGKVIYLCEK